MRASSRPHALFHVYIPGQDQDGPQTRPLVKLRRCASARMAATLLSTSAASSQLIASGKNGVFSPSRGLLCKVPKGLGLGRGGKATCMASSVPEDRMTDMGKRQLMKLLLLGAVSLPAAGMVAPYNAFALPDGALLASDDSGNDIIAADWLKTHGPNDRTLAEGLNGDPTYIVVDSDGKLANYGINAICTHLGCVVPWFEAENKFMCPCHGSQYNYQGMVIQGPAPLSLALAHQEVVDGKVVFVPWVEQDFRTGENPWWS